MFSRLNSKLIDPCKNSPRRQKLLYVRSVDTQFNLIQQGSLFSRNITHNIMCIMPPHVPHGRLCSNFILTHLKVEHFSALIWHPYNIPSGFCVRKWRVYTSLSCLQKRRFQTIKISYRNILTFRSMCTLQRSSNGNQRTIYFYFVSLSKPIASTIR